jgi:hypothetical protein
MRWKPLLIPPLLLLQGAALPPTGCGAVPQLGAGMEPGAGAGPAPLDVWAMPSRAHGAAAASATRPGAGCGPSVSEAPGGGQLRNDNADILHGLGAPELMRSPLENRTAEPR